MKHLETVGETYWEHLRFAWSVGFVLFVHGLFPWIWVDRASEMMYEKSVARMGEKPRRESW